MTLHIDLSTNEYPRFDGDIELAPSHNWAQVTETERPEGNEETIWVEAWPELVDGQWTQTWEPIPRPPYQDPPL